ncbi:hypothetical protein [Methylobacterium iners]|uniref:ATPase n=1 Tax=Methylobacterium iners TaxID=418707 RepID=A0ABQ4S4N4_9HYPH|nr:hypothetical protein [Methylobacterium iners]GJD98034.1 hypothetical protein OCOJLMKI_5273 [Methylobacterium iners]
MDPIKRAPWDLTSDGTPSIEVRAAVEEGSLSKVLRLVGPFDDLESEAPPARRSSAKDWAKLIDRIREAAAHSRAIEAQAHEQELRVQDLLDRAREDIQAAAERVRAADARAAEMEARTEKLLKSADQRVKAAEERARVAEEWLARVYDTISQEFVVEPGDKSVA